MKRGKKRDKTADVRSSIGSLSQASDDQSSGLKWARPIAKSGAYTDGIWAFQLDDPACQLPHWAARCPMQQPTSQRPAVQCDKANFVDVAPRVADARSGFLGHLERTIGGQPMAASGQKLKSPTECTFKDRETSRE